MKFCPKCGIMLTMKNGKLVCSKCGHEEGPVVIQVKEKVDKGPEVGEGVVGTGEETLPLTDEKCPKCGNMRSYSWSLQTRAGDEGPTSFFKCTKCKHTWREYR
ncbi:transcription factor S [Nanoarchaeota archaeon]